MLKIERTNVTGWEAAIRGMRNPYDSWKKSDSTFNAWIDYDCGDGRGTFLIPKYIGDADTGLMEKLVTSGDCHAKFARMLIVTADVTAPRFWWPEFDQYKVGTVTDSCSTMHTIMRRLLTLEDFSMDGTSATSAELLREQIEVLNYYITQYKQLRIKDDNARSIYFRSVIAMLPQSYNQRRTIQVSYQSLRNMYIWRKNHKLAEWHTFCAWIESLPHSDLITA